MRIVDKSINARQKTPSLLLKGSLTGEKADRLIQTIGLRQLTKLLTFAYFIPSFKIAVFSFFIAFQV